MQQVTFCVNSVAHTFGETTFDDTITPRDHILTSILTWGEGYHNFHHEFPSDYRNGIHWYDYDPTKWLIYFFKTIGLAYDLNEFEYNEIKRGELDMKLKNIQKQQEKLNYGKPVELLPVWNNSRLEYEIKHNKRIIIIISEIAHDVTDFVGENKHPGGKKILCQRNGKDATKEFNGAIYNHTNAARNLMSHMRVAKMNSDTNFVDSQTRKS